MHKNSFNINLERQKNIVTIGFEQIEYREDICLLWYQREIFN